MHATKFIPIFIFCALGACTSPAQFSVTQTKAQTIMPGGSSKTGNTIKTAGSGEQEHEQEQEQEQEQEGNNQTKTQESKPLDQFTFFSKVVSELYLLASANDISSIRTTAYALSGTYLRASQGASNLHTGINALAFVGGGLAASGVSIGSLNQGNLVKGALFISEAGRWASNDLAVAVLTEAAEQAACIGSKTEAGNLADAKEALLLTATIAQRRLQKPNFDVYNLVDSIFSRSSETQFEKIKELKEQVRVANLIADAAKDDKRLKILTCLKSPSATAG